MEKIDPIYNIYLLIKNGNINTAKNELNNIDNNYILKNIKGYKSLKLRLLILDNNLDEILNLFDNYEMMSRDWVDFILYLDNNNIFNIIDKYWDKIINITFNENNVTDLYNNLNKLNFINFIKNFEYKQLIINKNNNYFLCKNNYYHDDLLKTQIKILEENINVNNININNINIKYILDGGNILYSNKGKISNLSYNKLIKFYNQNKDNSLIVLNKKHKNNINNNPKFKDIKILYTPFKINDDFYILYLSLINKAFIISNDEYSDHIDNFSVKIPNLNFLKIYLDEKLIKYNDKLKEIKNFTRVIQIIDNKLYIPTKKGFIILI